MLQTRIPHRLCALVLAVIVVSCLLIIPSGEAQQRSCGNTVAFLEASGQSNVPKSEIYDDLKDEATVSGICKLDKTCCSESAELTFKMATSGDYKQKIQTMLINHLMPCHNHTFLGEFVKYIRASKVNLVSQMKRQFSFYFTPYEHIFDEFYAYLEQGVRTGDLCLMEEKFTKVSFEMFLAAYVVTSTVNNANEPLPNTDAFRLCFYNYFVDLRGDSVYNKLHGFLRAYNLTMRYVRALKMIENVIEGVLDLPLTDQCQSALMKMTYCSQCAGYNGDLLPCQGLCLNSLRGCLVDFADIVEPIHEVTEALVNLNKILVNPYNPWDQITLLNSYFFSTVTETRVDFTDIKNNLFSQCDTNGPTNRNKRSAAAPAVHRSREAVEEVRERRFVSERAAPPAPYAAMNQSSYCIASALPIFTNMAEGICSREGISGADTNCWTGLSYGSYERAVIDLERSAQRNNPELVVCTRQSRLRKQVAQLHYITRELNVVSGAQDCSSDDEDCVDMVPHTCNYFEFPDSYEYRNSSEEIESSSGSGSGTEEGRFRDEEDDNVCAEGIAEEGETTPTIIMGPDTTEMDVTTFSGDNDTLSVGSSAERLASMSLLTLGLAAVGLFWTSGSRHCL